MELIRFNKLNPRGWNSRELPNTGLPLHCSDPTPQGKAGQGQAAAPHPCRHRGPSAPLLQPGAAPGPSPRPAERTQRGAGGRPGPRRVAYLHGHFRGRIDGQGGGRGGWRPEVQHGIAAGEHGSGALGAALRLGLRVRLRVGAAVGGERGDRRRHLGAGVDGTGRSWQLRRALEVASPAERAGWGCLLKLWLFKTENTF